LNGRFDQNYIIFKTCRIFFKKNLKENKASVIFYLSKWNLQNQIMKNKRKQNKPIVAHWPCSFVERSNQQTVKIGNVS